MRRWRTFIATLLLALMISIPLPASMPALGEGIRVLSYTKLPLLRTYLKGMALIDIVARNRTMRFIASQSYTVPKPIVYNFPWSTVTVVEGSERAMLAKAMFYSLLVALTVSMIVVGLLIAKRMIRGQR